jgi:hypothetical protein
MQIIRKFLPYKKPDDHTGCNADGESPDFDQRKQFFTEKISPGDSDEGFQHRLKKVGWKGNSA